MFRAYIQASSHLSSCFRPGLQALGSNSNYISVQHTRAIQGSVDIDSCLSNLYPNSPRWDYIIGYSGKVYFIEIHPATDGEVNLIIKKSEWVRTWIDQNLNKLNILKKEPFLWVASGKVSILRGSNRARLLAKAKISFPTRRAELK